MSVEPHPDVRWPTWQRGVLHTEVLDDGLAVGSRFTVLSELSTLDGIVGELAPPRRFGWAAVSDGLSFYQSWLLLDTLGGGTRTIFHEAARGASALLRAADRGALTHAWVDALPDHESPPHQEE